MRRIGRLLFLLLSALWVSNLAAQHCKVTFRLDLSEKTIKEPATVGVRGSVPPLSWESTLPMKPVAGEEGVYEVTVDFPEEEAGRSVEYKYYFDDQWDNNRFGPAGNRIVVLQHGHLRLPTDTWDQLESFSREALLSSSDYELFFAYVYIIGSGKKKGKSPAQVAREYQSFWGDSGNVVESPQYLMAQDQVASARSPMGDFEILEDKGRKVKYRIRNAWKYYFANLADAEGNFMGVSPQDLMEFTEAGYYVLARRNGWEMNWEEAGDYVTVTIADPN